MKLTLCCLLLFGVGAFAETREKRQATYTFPGPRNEAANRQAAAAAAALYQQPPQHQQPRSSARVFVEEQEENAYQPSPRRQLYQGQPIQYVPVQPRGPPQHQQQAAPVQQQPPLVYEPPRAQPPPQRQARKRVSPSSRANKYGSPPQQSLNGGADEEEEEEQGPDPLTLLLEDSKFTCGGKQDGYYADDSVNCQVFHYCVSGARHSWMCPEGTVFHQVHLNCVPDSQDICSQSQKFHFVNDYLYKPVDYQGPNNTARYAQRYYPDGYVVGDPLVAPHDNQAPLRPQAPPPPQQRTYRPQAQVASYPAPAPVAPVARPQPQVVSYPAAAPAPRQQHRQVAPQAPPPPQQAVYNPPPSQHGGYSPQQIAAAAARGLRPNRPTHSYQAEVPHGYRGGPRQEPPPQQAVPVQDEVYQHQPEVRRQVIPTGYAPQQPSRHQQPPPQYRPSSARNPQAVARAHYPSYASNQAPGVQYDEDY